MKVIKTILSLGVILFIGYGFYQWKLTTEVRSYMLVRVGFPQNDLIGVMIKEAPQSVCFDKLDELIDIVLSECSECTIESQECYDELPSSYEGIFENESLAFPYVAIDMEYPERHIMYNLPDGGFNEYCRHMKRSNQNTVCIE